jgi:DNA-binding MarR family transcriptional regulator
VSRDDARSVDLQLGLLLRQAHRRASASLAAALAPLGLAGNHFGVMLLLERDRTSTQKQLLAELGSDKAGMVRTVDDLARRGFVERVQSVHDRRVYHLSLTAAGHAAFADACRLAGVAAQDIFAGLSGSERATLADLLSQVIAPPEPVRSDS